MERVFQLRVGAYLFLAVWKSFWTRKSFPFMPHRFSLPAFPSAGAAAERARP